MSEERPAARRRPAISAQLLCVKLAFEMDFNERILTWWVTSGRPHLPTPRLSSNYGRGVRVRGGRGAVGREAGNRSRNAQDGRERLIESARAIFRSRVRREVSRLDIARHAGVAPGLVTYHFESNAKLVLAVTRPVLSEAIARLIAALDSPASLEARLEQSAILFIDFARDNGALLDLFVEAVTESGDEDGRELLHACIDRLERFFAEMVEAQLIIADTDPTLLLMTMWGMCRLVGETPPLPLKNVRPDAGLDERALVEARFIARLILQGAKPPVQDGS